MVAFDGAGGVASAQPTTANKAKKPNFFIFIHSKILFASGQPTSGLPPPCKSQAAPGLFRQVARLLARSFFA